MDRHPVDNTCMSLPKLDVQSLSPAERLALIEQLWDSLSPEDVELTPAQREELDRRLEDAEQHPADGVTWEEAKRQIRERKR